VFQRMDRILIELPIPKYGDANAASVVQELLGGKYGEMSTLNNYMFQSFNFRGKKKLKPFYDLLASITAEEFGHVELVSTAINLLSKGQSFPGDPDIAPLQNGKDGRNAQYFIATAQTAFPQESMGNPWRGDYVTSTGNLISDLVHNYLLEIGARVNKMRVYEMTDHPTAREMIGYLLVRGGTHIVAYARALEVATGVDVTKMLPIPSLSNRAFDHARKFEDQGLGNILYTWSPTDYRDINKIWKGPHPENGQELRVIVGTPEGAPVPELEELPEEFAPGINRDHYEYIVKRLMERL
jgi:Mn-containing catalase